MSQERPFKFTDRDFNCLRELVSRHTGISLSEAKRDMVYSRLSKRLRHLGMENFRDYCRLLSEAEVDHEELSHFTNAITTNLTAFFREEHHFDFLAETLLPALMRSRADSRRVRIWSAGCSTGEEPYSLAMVVKEAVPHNHGWDIKILATDLDSNVLATAAKGVYGENRLKNISPARQRRWFLKGRNGMSGLVKVAPALRELITFKQLNLMKPWPMKGPFDIIFCRNVVIYFDKPTQRTLVERYADLMAQDSHLFLGHSETLYKVTDRFKLLGKTIYQKIA